MYVNTNNARVKPTRRAVRPTGQRPWRAPQPVRLTGSPQRVPAGPVTDGLGAGLQWDTMLTSVRSTCVVLLLASASLAHVPRFPDGAGDSMDNPVVIDDIDLSQVVYFDATGRSPRLWLAFDAQAGQQAYFQIGVPVIGGLEAFRPAVALVGPGLPRAELPVDLPAELGATPYPTSDRQPEFFHEPFSGTDSWILRSETVAVPQNGRYYLLGYVPSGQTGKFWVAVGRREQFGLNDILSLPADLARVREFHEVPPGTSAPCFLIPLSVLLMLALLILTLRIAGGGRPGIAHIPAVHRRHGP